LIYTLVANVITAEIFSDYFNAEFNTEFLNTDEIHLRYLEIAVDLGIITKQEFDEWKEQPWMPLLKDKIDALKKGTGEETKTALRYYLDRLDEFAERAVVGEKIRTLVMEESGTVKPEYQEFVDSMRSKGLLFETRYDPKAPEKLCGVLRLHGYRTRLLNN